MRAKLRLQIIALLVIALTGTSYIGARYAHAGRLFGHDGYTVTVHLADSGGIFAGADATYRGVSIGRVKTMTLTSTGVDVQVAVEDTSVPIPADTLAVVADQSALGEQYLDFQPRTDAGPYLHDGSQIAQADTRTPVPTDALITNIDNLLTSVPGKDLQTVITQLGLAFQGTGPALRRIVDTTSSFVSTAQQKYAVTAALIEDSASVLQRQVDSGDDIATFTQDLDLLSQSLRGSDTDLRTVIDTGSTTAGTLREVIAENAPDLARLISRLVTTNRVVRAHLPGIRGVLVLAPYGIEGAYSILAVDPQTGEYAARFSLSLQPQPTICTSGARIRTPFETSPRNPTKVGTCARTTSGTSAARTPSSAATDDPSADRKTTAATTPATGNGAGPVVATYDEATKTLTPATGPDTAGSVDASELGSESWKWMLLGPAVTK